MAIDENPFSPVASINMNTTDLTKFLNEKRAMNEKKVKAYWIPKGQMFEAHRNYGGSTTKYVSRGSPGNIGGSTANWPRNQYFANEKKRTHHSENLSHRMPREFQKKGNYHPGLLPTNTRNLKKYEPKEKARGARVAEHHNKPRFVLPSNNEVDDIWELARHKKFPKPLTRTQKRRVLRERTAAKREVAGKMVTKSKFCRKATEDKGSEDNDDLLSEGDTRENKTINFRVGDFHILVDCNTGVVIMPEKFKLWNGDEEKTVNDGLESMDTKEAEILEGSSDVITREEHPSKPKVFPTNDTMGSLPSLYALLLVNSPANFQALLGRDWVLSNECIPSPMHKLLLFRKDDELKIVEADAQPFQANTSTVEARWLLGKGDGTSVQRKSYRRHIEGAEVPVVG
ncbi:hypothetical protein F511_26019 [Dorcoceras hygrometricum]|uniref:Uncharacterized protein n=1 Tax=Dorcoceras hygrometricum TaxID=472368 RepID=A0A2Z7D4P5_9LAMI|nr:hypothetical protein F511_26019 [Dorcoceras hygrometricum]